jgi:5-methylcytosine-specific restriction protein B
MTENESAPQSYWFVGAAHDGRTDDQIPRFLNEGIWENGYNDRYLDVVGSMRPGDRIAIKSFYTRTHNIPFDTRGNRVSVMAIKAIGTIVENLNDGKRVRVDWTKEESPREWYFYTHR